jgi:accessory colonization factor AcfC
MAFETSPQGQGELEKRVGTFFDLDHDQDWNTTVREGAQLYTVLKGTNPKEAIKVRDVLVRTLAVIKNSGAGDENTKSDLIKKITAILNT